MVRRLRPAGAFWRQVPSVLMHSPAVLAVRCLNSQTPRLHPLTTVVFVFCEERKRAGPKVG